jgi:holo-[acyl-carrier protein] synthase
MIGVDLVDVPGFARQLEDTASGFLAATFTPAEQRAKTPHRLAARFAAKEAFLKAWSATNRGRPPRLGTVDLREIEVVDDGYGRPVLALHGEVAAACDHTAEVSLSHDGDAAIAVVVLIPRCASGCPAASTPAP